MHTYIKFNVFILCLYVAIRPHVCMQLLLSVLHITRFIHSFLICTRLTLLPVNCSLQEEKLLTEAKEAIETELQSTYVVCSLGRLPLYIVYCRNARRMH